jgi:hypothetical protein
MEWLPCVAYFFGGLFLTNAIPHFVSGTMGRAFQSPFAKPSGEGLSTSTVNVLWGAFNFVIAYFLILQVGAFDLHFIPHVLSVGAGSLFIALFSAQHFGKFHGGNKGDSP